MTITYDPKCYELARDFIARRDSPSYHNKLCDSLAAAIQQAIEDWFAENPTATMR